MGFVRRTYMYKELQDPTARSLSTGSIIMPDVQEHFQTSTCIHCCLKYEHDIETYA